MRSRETAQHLVAVTRRSQIFCECPKRKRANRQVMDTRKLGSELIYPFDMCMAFGKTFVFVDLVVEIRPAMLQRSEVLHTQQNM